MTTFYYAIMKAIDLSNSISRSHPLNIFKRPRDFRLVEYGLNKSSETCFDLVLDLPELFVTKVQSYQ